jgi:hypothetical protein
MPEFINGAVEITVVLDPHAGAQTSALAKLLATWARAVEIGFFGPARLRPLGTLETHGLRVSEKFACEHVPQTTFYVLSLMIRRFSDFEGQVESLEIFHDAQPVAPVARRAVPPVPQSIPFAVEYPEDLKQYLRVEIEFGRELTVSERDAIFDAFSIWDTLIETFGYQERGGRHVSYQSRLLSPAIVEHEVNGYYASLECLHYIVWMGLRLDQSLGVDRITME